MAESTSFSLFNPADAKPAPLPDKLIRPSVKALFERRTRAAAFVTLSFEIELQRFPNQFEGEFKALDDCVAEDDAFGLLNRFDQPPRRIARVRFAFRESLLTPHS